MENKQQYLSANDVKYHLANTPQITFEVTDACNLKCIYCGYGQFYSDYDIRENKRLPVEKAIVLLDYLHDLWNSSLNASMNKTLYISFYGGEPLLNMSFIQTIVDYFEKKVNFNAVLHNCNSVESIYRFFKEYYDKTPRIGELNNMGIRPEVQETFMETYRNSAESLHQSEHYDEIERDISRPNLVINPRPIHLFIRIK